MTPFTKEQARDRFVTLPPQLQDAIFSSGNAEIIGDLCEKTALSSDVAEGIASIVTAVLLGFLPFDNMNAEIQALGIDATVAKTIGFSLSSEIIDPVRPALGKIQQSPTGASVQAAAPLMGKVMRDIGGGTAATPPPVNKLADKGWSHLSANDPIMRVTVTRNIPGGPATNRTAPPPPAPASFASIASATPAAPRPQPQPQPRPQPQMQQPRPPMPQTQSQAPAAPVKAPAPTILQTNNQFTAVPKNTDFRLTKPNAGAQVQFDNIKAAPRAMPAVVEFGGRTPTAPGISPTAQRAPQNRPPASVPPLASSPISTNDVRRVTEMTMAPPPVSTPRPPAAPQPQQPPQQQFQQPRPQPMQQQPQPQPMQHQGKVIVQNFSENDPPQK